MVQKQQKLKCSICKKEYINTEKETLIQVNMQDGKAYCMSCAIENYDTEDEENYRHEKNR